jgi:hypothetical protein
MEKGGAKAASATPTPRSSASSTVEVPERGRRLTSFSFDGDFDELSSPSLFTDGRRTESSSPQPDNPGPLPRIGSRWPILHEKYGSVVTIDGRVVSVRCWDAKCKANAAGSNRHPYLNGIPGLHKHFLTLHNAGVAMEEVPELCLKTPVSDADAALIRAGQEPSVKIKKTWGRS